jgi:hypothetical protein
MPDATIAMTATQDCTFALRKLLKGDTFHASASDAEILMAAGLATRALTSDDETAEAPKSRRQYKRRDLRPEE